MCSPAGMPPRKLQYYSGHALHCMRHGRQQQDLSYIVAHCILLRRTAALACVWDATCALHDCADLMCSMIAHAHAPSRLPHKDATLSGAFCRQRLKACCGMQECCQLALDSLFIACQLQQAKANSLISSTTTLNKALKWPATLVAAAEQSWSRHLEAPDQGDPVALQVVTHHSGASPLLCVMQALSAVICFRLPDQAMLQQCCLPMGLGIRTSTDAGLQDQHHVFCCYHAIIERRSGCIQVAETLAELHIAYASNVTIEGKLRIQFQLTDFDKATIIIHGPADFAQNNPKVHSALVPVQAVTSASTPACSRCSRQICMSTKAFMLLRAGLPTCQFIIMGQGIVCGLISPAQPITFRPNQAPQFRRSFCPMLLRICFMHCSVSCCMHETASRLTQQKA